MHSDTVKKLFPSPKSARRSATLDPCRRVRQNGKNLSLERAAKADTLLVEAEAFDLRVELI